MEPKIIPKGKITVRDYGESASLRYVILANDGNGEISLFSDGRFAFNAINGPHERWPVIEKMIDEFIFLRIKLIAEECP